jgi:hypothetical protein
MLPSRPGELQLDSTEQVDCGSLRSAPDADLEASSLISRTVLASAYSDGGRDTPPNLDSPPSVSDEGSHSDERLHYIARPSDLPSSMA